MNNQDAITIFVIDDHPVVHEGVALLLASDPSISIVGSSLTGRDAIDAVAESQPDVVLLDLRLPDMPGVDLIGRFKALVPRPRVIVFTADADQAAIRVALESGAHGCLLKDAGTHDLVDAIHRVSLGIKVIDPRLADAPGSLKEHLFRTGLTRREYEVLRLVATGMSNPEIAMSLGLARNTVKTYLQTAMQKLGARNRVEAISRAHEARLL